MCGGLESRSIQLLGNLLLNVSTHRASPISLVTKNWATKLQDLWNEHGFDEQLNLTVREERFIWHLFSGASTLDIKRYIQEDLNGRTPESFDERIIFMSMFNDLAWIGNTETCLYNAKEVAASATEFKTGRWCTSLDPRQKYVVERFSSVIHPIRYYPATEPLSLGQLRKGGSNYRFQGTFENNKILINALLSSNLLCIYNQICHLYETENQILTPRTAEDQEQIDREPEQLTLITQKNKKNNGHKLEATRCCSSQRIARRWFGKLPIRQHLSERWKINNSTSPVNLWWKETVLLLDAKNNQNQGILKVRDYNQFLTIMSRSDQWLELKYSNLQEHGWLKCKYHHNNLEIRSLGYPRQFILAETDHKILKPRHHSSQYAADDREHRKQVRLR